MAIASGIAAQLGVKAETTYGTSVTPDRFYEFVSESLEADIGVIDAPQLGGGRFLRSDRTKKFIRGGKGALELVVMNKGFGLLFEHMLGSNTVTGAGDDKTQTIVPDAAALKGKSLTIQAGKPDISGTVQPFTFTGCKIVDWELKCALEEALKLALTIDAKTVVTSTALAAATYTATQEMFIFTEGALTIGGTAISVKNASIKGNNALATDRRFLGNAKKEPLANGLADISGTLEGEFEDLTRYAAFVAGTQAQLVLTFTLATEIAAGAPFTMTVTIPAIEYTGETPKVGGPDIVMQGAPFRALYNGVDPIITIEYVSSDTAA